jgi:hypothetical protein
VVLVADRRFIGAMRAGCFAATEFGHCIDSTTLLENEPSWVGTRLNYVPGSSDSIDGAADKP